MRGRLKYGVPIAAGLATGGYALSQGEDPGSVALAGIGGALGGAAGLLGARELAGKYAGKIAETANAGKRAAVQGLTSASQGIYPPIKATGGGPVTAEQVAEAEKINALRAQLAGESKRAAVLGGTAGALQGLPNLTKAGLQPGLKTALGVAAVPAAALAAGLGGVALGAIPGSMGVPGFVQGGGIDPEHYGSSNPPGAIHKLSTLQYGV